MRIEIAEFDEVVKEIETGEMADFDTEDMEEEVLIEAVYDVDLNCISPRKLEMVPKKKFAGPTGLAKWTNLFRRNEDRRARHVIKKQKVLKCMLKNINDEIYWAIEIFEGFEDFKRNLDVKAIYQAIKFAATGQGGHSVFLDVFKLMNLRVENNKWLPYFNQFSTLERQLLSRDNDPVVILNSFLNKLKKLSL